MNIIQRPSLVSLIAQAVGLGWAVMAFPISPAIAATDSRDDFRRCVSNLTRLNVSAEEAASACSRNLAPENLYKCVTEVSQGGYESGAALNACRQVRQPREMAACVTRIRRNLTGTVATDVLESCRRSLLPVRYANCVVGVGQGATGVQPAIALSNCNDELFFPREIDPTFIPYADGQPIVAPPAPVTPAPEIITPAPAPAPAPAPVRGLF